MTRRLVAVLIALVGTAGIVALGLSTWFPEEDRSTFAPEGPVRTVDVDVEVGRVQVVRGPDGGAVVDRTRRALRGTPVAEESLVDGVLRVRARCQRIFTFGCKVDYRLQVPAGVTVRVRTERGPVSIEDIAGMVEVDTEAGRVRLARTRGPVRVNTSSADFDAVDLVAEFLDVTTDAGGIRMSLAEPSGRVGLRTGAGNIDLALPPVGGGYRVDAVSGAGDVDVAVVNNPGGSRAVIIRSDAGNIVVRSR